MMDRKTLIDGGIDYNKGLERFMGDAELYERVLLMFLDEPCFERARDALMRGDYKELFNYAHEIKGASGNLDMTAVYKTSSELTGLLRESKYDEFAVRQAYLAMEKAYNIARAAIIKAKGST